MLSGCSGIVRTFAIGEAAYLLAVNENVDIPKSVDVGIAPLDAYFCHGQSHLCWHTQYLLYSNESTFEFRKSKARLDFKDEENHYHHGQKRSVNYMQPLDKALQEKKTDFKEFEAIARKILNYIPNVLSGYSEKNGYRIYTSEIAGTTKYVRPINFKLFTLDINEFDEKLKTLNGTFEKIKSGDLNISPEEKENINSSLYTIQQSIGAGLDLLVGSNSARKHAGNRFEELIRALFNEIGISNKKTVLQIPYETVEGQKVYKCENDLILSPYEKVRSSSISLDENEIVVSIKTTSKDRMGKIFIDKMLLERFVKHKQKVIGIFLNDVQRKDSDNIAFTLVSGLFMVYTKFLTELEGIYYLDPPPNTNKKPYNRYMKPLSELITTDVFKMLSA